MSEIFLSAGVPGPEAGDYYRTADPYLIQVAVRELVIAVADTHTIVWGGQPAITPMVLEICDKLRIDNSSAFVLYQSKFFEGRYPEVNERFGNKIFTESVPGDLAASLLLMREAMLSRPGLGAAVFIGGKDGVEGEYDLFRRFHPNMKVLPVPATGGAALSLARRIGGYDDVRLRDIDFAGMFYTELR